METQESHRKLIVVFEEDEAPEHLVEDMAIVTQLGLVLLVVFAALDWVGNFFTKFF